MAAIKVEEAYEERDETIDAAMSYRPVVGRRDPSPPRDHTDTPWRAGVCPPYRRVVPWYGHGMAW